MRRTSKTSKISLNGDGTARVELTRGLSAIIDEADIPLVAPHKWHAKPSRKGVNYAMRNSKTKPSIGIPMHRDIAGAGDWDGKTSVDHINRDGLDNRRSNLRLATNTLQKLNQNVRSDNTSGDPGIHLRPSGEWQARISVRNQRVSLGHFKTFGEAKLCRDAVLAVVDSLIKELAPSIDRRVA